ncbi:hypothetical protein GOP47_0017530 [Adiantum capillus-veneris]|uniref:Uncharacterized protein n=1 Tax=Adiantum capillus-veneris TaxID=13818 RepID=A0A9D4UG05_ADICA|nr:hypothetical protein GOP47_0017530 [Adiantum capillus-veneris]
MLFSMALVGTSVLLHKGHAVGEKSRQRSYGSCAIWSCLLFALFWLRWLFRMLHTGESGEVMKRKGRSSVELASKAAHGRHLRSPQQPAIAAKQEGTSEFEEKSSKELTAHPIRRKRRTPSASQSPCKRAKLSSSQGSPISYFKQAAKVEKHDSGRWKTPKALLQSNDVDAWQKMELEIRIETTKDTIDDPIDSDIDITYKLVEVDIAKSKHNDIQSPRDWPLKAPA